MVEMMIVMAIIVILVSIAIPQYQKALIRSKESVLKNNLFTLRQVIDEYTYDKKKAPQSLQDLVAAGYLQNIPIDPITNSQRYLAHHQRRCAAGRRPNRAGHLRREERIG